MQKSRLLLPVGLFALGLSLLLAAPVLGHQDPQPARFIQWYSEHSTRAAHIG
jgi:hypothetical protein